MHKSNIIIIIFIFISSTSFAQTSIYDIQYTTISGGGFYPSLYSGQSVTTGGIVTATDYLGGRFFISSSQGGAWNGLFVYDNNYLPNIGDSVLISGIITEYQGYTEIKNLSTYQVINTSNPLPQTATISSADVSCEAYEGVLVEINNCSVSALYDSWGNWEVNDGSGICSVRPGIFDLEQHGFPLFQNYTFEKIVGVVGINYNQKNLHPRSIDDLQSDSSELFISTPDKIVYDSITHELYIYISILNQNAPINSYSLQIAYNDSVFEYTGYNKSNTLSETGIITDVSNPGSIILNFSGNIICNDIDTLVKLLFIPKYFGEAELQFAGTTINETSLTYLSPGVFEYLSSECDMPIGDTLTIVQRPLLNIPLIVLPGEEFNIVCFAPESASSWSAELLYEHVSVPINIIQFDYDATLERWTLNSVIPNVDTYELYDLRVTTSNGLIDTVRNAIKVIDQYKTNYNFIHITDTHLPGKTYYGEPGYETDVSEMEDLYEVIKDINLINPEFVLLTGDLLNEGELEDFECLRNHTMAIELLQLFEVPVYIVPGNHDIGGWEDTPPVQGTARREWWRFFGWRQREITPTQTTYQSHDYSFNYGNIHFTGLEAYDNYDMYMDSVYGYESFTSEQIAWLQNDLAAAGNMTKVLFYHYDFKHELNLTNLGVDMALWGHNHDNTGDINVYPYNLSTANTCNGDRTYRVIRVNNGSLQAENAIQSHVGSDMLSIDFNMANNGSLDLVSATISNNHNLSFDGGLVKFIMPISQFGFTVTNGTLMQVLENGTTATCYVNVDIPAFDQITVTIKKAEISISELNLKSSFTYYPSPFNEKLQVEFEIQQKAMVTISVYNLAGQLVRVLLNESKVPGKYATVWDAFNSTGKEVENGTYILKYKLNGNLLSSGLVSLIR